MEDDDGNIHLKNLSVHQCMSEQDGIDLLMMGNFIRQVSLVPFASASMMASKRSESHSFWVDVPVLDQVNLAHFISTL